MNRSWIALIVVVAVIGTVIAIQASGPRQVHTPAPTKEGPPPIVAKAPPPGVPDPSAPPEPKEEPKEAPKEEPKEEPKEIAEEPAAPDALLEKADALLAAGSVAEAQKLLSDAVTQGAMPDPAPFKERLAKLNMETLFSPKPSPMAITYKVAPGDFLGRIAGKHKTTVGLIKTLNGLKGSTIHAGRALKIISGGFDIEVAKSQFLLTVTKDGTWIRELKVGLGKGGSTPVGEFVAGPKLIEPAYTGEFPHVPFGDKERNPLGTRWITIQGPGGNQYGIHGTWQPDSIGKEMSKGCVRMLNEDVEWLFDLIVPGVSKIVVKP